MRTTVVSGMLGSGKTTFIRNQVKGRAEKTVVLVNDFGTLGIDGEILSADGIESIELPSGCVCCTMKFDLITTIQRIREQFSPEHLMIEPSGVASPSGVLEALASAGAGPAVVISIVDTTEFKDLHASGMYGSFFEDQIRNADVILLNKTDLAPEQLVYETEKIVCSLNPAALVQQTVNASVSFALSEPRQREIHAGDCHVQFDTLSFRITGRPLKKNVDAIFSDIANGRFGTVARAKALISTTDGPFRFDSVFGKIDQQRFEKDVEDSRLVVIGKGMDEEGLRGALGSGLSHD